MKVSLAYAGTILLGWLATSAHADGEQKIEEKPPVDKESKYTPTAFTAMRRRLLFLRSCSHSYTEYNYGQLLYLSILFYEAQRSGKLPADNRIPWREDSNIKDGNDHCVLCLSYASCFSPLLGLSCRCRLLRLAPPDL